jgi:4-aminobutyrate aminotransferase-like enzyme
MAMAATCAVLDVIDKERLQQNASETGSYLRQKLEEMREFPWVGDVRGSGLFQGVEIVTDKETKGHDGDRAKRIIAEMRKRGVLVSRDGTEHNILKIKPPITFNKQNVDTLIETLRTVLKDMVNELEHLSTTSSQDHEAPTG